MKYYVSIGLLLTIVACNELTGGLTLHRALNVVDKKGNKVTVPAGTSEAKLQYKAEKRQIDLKINDATNGETQIRIVVPSNVNLPRETGDVALKGSEIGQAFDLNGRLVTETVTSETTRTAESCTYRTTEYNCRWVGTGGGRGRRHGGRHRVQRCGYYPMTRVGSHEVEYHYVTTGVSLNAEVSESSEVVGQLAVARTTSSSKVYESRGNCQ